LTEESASACQNLLENAIRLDHPEMPIHRRHLLERPDSPTFARVGIPLFSSADDFLDPRRGGSLSNVCSLIRGWR
jgi:hypothetical protein